MAAWLDCGLQMKEVFGQREVGVKRLNDPRVKVDVFLL